MAKTNRNQVSLTRPTIEKSPVSSKKNENSDIKNRLQRDQSSGSIVTAIHDVSATIDGDPPQQAGSVADTKEGRQPVQEHEVTTEHKPTMESSTTMEIAGYREQYTPQSTISTTQTLEANDEHPHIPSVAERDHDISPAVPSVASQIGASSVDDILETEDAHKVCKTSATSSLDTPIFTEDEIDILFSKISEEPNIISTKSECSISSSKSHGTLMPAWKSTDTNALPRSATTEFRSNSTRNSATACCELSPNKRPVPFESQWTKGWFPRRDRGQRPSVSHQVAHTGEPKKAPVQMKETIGLFESLAYSNTTSGTLQRALPLSTQLSSDSLGEMFSFTDAGTNFAKASLRRWSGSWNRKSRSRAANGTCVSGTKPGAGDRKRKTWTAGITKARPTSPEEYHQVDGSHETGPRTSSKRILSNKYWADRRRGRLQLASHAPRLDKDVGEVCSDDTSHYDMMQVEQEMNSLPVRSIRSRRWFSRSAKNIALGSSTNPKTVMPRRESEVRRIISLCKGKVVGNWQEGDVVDKLN